MPEVGTTYLLPEEAYLFGTGPLLCRVTAVVRPTMYDNEPWWEVEAMVKPPSTVGVAHERRLYVRASMLATARRKPTTP